VAGLTEITKIHGGTMSLDHLHHQFHLTSKALEYNLEGISNEEALEQPDIGGNCINWLVGHIIASRDTYYMQIGRDALMPESKRERYDRGSQPVSAGGDIYQLSDLFQYFEQSNKTFRDLFDSINEQRIILSSDQVKELAGILFHEAYHVGQVAIVRRALGKEGVIK